MANNVLQPHSNTTNATFPLVLEVIWCICYTNYSNTPLRQFIHQKGVDNLELPSRRNQRVWSQKERRESHHAVGSRRKDSRDDRAIRVAQNQIKPQLKHFFSTHMFPCVACEGVRWAVSSFLYPIICLSWQSSSSSFLRKALGMFRWMLIRTAMERTQTLK